MSLRYIFFIFGKNVGKEEVKTLGGEKGGKKRARFVEGLDSNSVEYWQLASDIFSALLKDTFFIF